MIYELAARLDVRISLYSTSAEYSALDPLSPILRINTKSGLALIQWRASGTNFRFMVSNWTGDL